MSASFDRFKDKVLQMSARLRLRFNPFTPNHYVVAETYMKTGDRVHCIDEKHISAAAANLEAAYVMSEELPHDALIALTMTRTELHSFVCYMRQLDATYREQAQFIKRHIKPSRSPGEFKTSEEAAEVSAERYEQLTGEVAGDTSLRVDRELSKEYARDVSLAQIQRRTGGAA